MDTSEKTNYLGKNVRNGTNLIIHGCILEDFLSLAVEAELLQTARDFKIFNIQSYRKDFFNDR